ncbi:MAG: hypothetical protein COB02_17660 [Candidatus Cloacimonadota bacterium]|nr:MAG: hypothetical protein COB02_17660 [Candidatus Cloacimonadota bacterium]
MNQKLKKIIIAVLGVGCLCSVNYASEFDDIITSDLAQMDERDRVHDIKVLEEKEGLAENSAKVLSAIANIDTQIDSIDADLATYSDKGARAGLLQQRKKLFRKRREYKALAAGYHQKQVRMTRDLSYNSTAYRGSRGNAYDNGDSKWSTGNEKSSIDSPLWNKKLAVDKDKSVLIVKKEKDLKDIAKTLSESIFGEYNQEIYLELLEENVGNSTIDPRNLVMGNHVMIPYKIAMLVSMGIQQNALIDVTLNIITDFKDKELKRDMIRYAAFADETEESKKAFIEALMAAKLHGEKSDEFKKALTKYHRVSEGAEADDTQQINISSSSRGQIQFNGTFKKKLEVVSNASYEMELLPKRTKAKVVKAKREYVKLKNYVKDYGPKDSKSKKQLKVFQKAVNEAYTAVKKYKSSGSGSFGVDNRFEVENDPTGTRTSVNASINLKRDVKEMNSAIIKLVGDVAKSLGNGWQENQDFWESQKKDATTKLFALTDMKSENSITNQMLVRMKTLYGNMDKYNVDFYSDSNFSILRKRMIALVGMAMAVEAIQPAYWSRTDGKFRDLNATSALQHLGIDSDNEEFSFYDVGSGAKPQFEKLYPRSTSKVTQVAGIREKWKTVLTTFATGKADFRAHDEFESVVKDAEEFWEHVSNKLDNEWKRTGIGAGVGLGAGILGAIVLTQFWNPIGWVVAGVVATGAVAGVAVGHNADRKADLEKIQEYAALKMISELGLVSVKHGNYQMVQGMLYLDEVVKGYTR